MITKQQFWRRVDMRTRLKAGQVFDVVIIGAGATGLGIAVDAASRGLSVAVLDAQDFCAGTSSRSTKLIHGGVRYLSNPRNWPLIKEALFERRLLLQNAPQLVRPQSFVVPCYSYAQALFHKYSPKLFVYYAHIIPRNTRARQQTARTILSLCLSSQAGGRSLL